MERKKNQKKLNLNTVTITKINCKISEAVKGGKTNGITGLFCPTCRC